jgi:flagellar M-ring protein FliF
VQNIVALWIGLDRRRQIVLIATTVAVFLAVTVLGTMAGRPTMQLLYAGLENGAAGDVVRALEQRGVDYQIRGGSIYVPAQNRDELRMLLASEGLPSNGSRGYELLDALNGFGTTSQMFDAAYWRAKEGELARTIVASPHINQARVHLANTGSGPFLRDHQASASVSVSPVSGALTKEQANAIRHLVASAVTGMEPEKVAIIDAAGSLVDFEGSEVPAAMSGESRSQILRDRVLRLVEARVGPGNAVVEVSVETVTESEAIREKRIDPESRIAISTDLEERSDSSSNQANQVTVASNLPDGDGNAAEGSNAKTSSTRERINYEVSETEMEIIRAPGAIRRLAVAVLVNGTSEVGEDGKQVFSERSEQELSALRELVSAAVGFDGDRGDVISLKSMDLPVAAPLGTQAKPALFSGIYLDIMSLIKIAALVIVSLVLALFVIRPILKAASPTAQPQLASLPQPAPLQTESAATTAPALTGEIEDQETGQFTRMSDPQSLAANGPGSNTPALPDAFDTPVDRLRSMIGERQEETVEILRSWLEDSEETV